MDSEELPLVMNDILQVPLHSLSRQLRAAQKSQEQGANMALKAIRDLHQRVSTKESDGETVQADKIILALDKIVSKLVEVKEQVQSSSGEMQSTLESITFRVAMRNGTLPVSGSHDSKRPRPSSNTEGAFSGSERMLDLAVISGHLLRTNRFETFRSLCKEAECDFLAKDVEVFQNHATIFERLDQKHDAEPALAWSAENRSALKKKGSNFEFDLRLRQFCDIVSKGELHEAVHFARKHLSQNTDNERMRKAMAMLAFPKGTLHNTPYKQLISEDCWATLAQEFLNERNGVLNLNSISPLELLIRVGLAAMRTQCCKPDGPGKATGCPACQPSLGQLALTLPRTMRERSFSSMQDYGGINGRTLGTSQRSSLFTYGPGADGSLSRRWKGLLPGDSSRVLPKGLQKGVRPLA